MKGKNKIFIFLVFLVSAIFSLNSIDLRNKIYSGFDVTLFFYQDYFKLHVLKREGGNPMKSNEYRYKIIEEGVYNYLVFGEKYENKWLMLYSDELLFLYDHNEEQKFMGVLGNNMYSESLWTADQFNSTSFLTENQISYKADNLMSSFALNRPWVNSGNKYAINEKIFITKKDYADRIIFSNGFVSYKKPYLYNLNSRVKKIKITDLKSKKEQILILQDTPNLQMFKLDFITENIVIEILEVYKGTKFKDTCINFIIFSEHDLI